MNGTHIIQATTGGFIPELIIDGKYIIKAGFTAGAVFKIEPYRDRLVITLVSDEGEIERLLLEVDAHDNIGVDWIRDNGELYLAGDWLTQCGLTRQPLAISVMPGKMVVQVQQDNMLA
ncbi:SymE family type I addiction module toxin [Serratia fonticola]|uniref:SymE family type I addiction module toxin n=1 Tax=Serratia fonticola TaxID=47917 RepID=UPI001AEAEA91|nr:SymE family type I addiction module toxin [Serratia fonticola]MBP0995700.1 SymE family type I addiction module toxin [Serratia fonticola]MBP0995707.1 SymE family type I addiction module toxin [Serratia fonticola]MBP1000875.1 SymE family type I addiction module toxin [Serratia fonticola]MBP1000882.1 SymE family type I addiction module toxin [Serratia fonticola]MBP1010561.1 SymE family type I addiction module toxin [Serratia fonticola]